MESLNHDSTVWWSKSFVIGQWWSRYCSWWPRLWAVSLIACGKFLLILLFRWASLQNVLNKVFAYWFADPKVRHFWEHKFYQGACWNASMDSWETSSSCYKFYLCMITFFLVMFMATPCALFFFGFLFLFPFLWGGGFSFWVIWSHGVQTKLSLSFTAGSEVHEGERTEACHLFNCWWSTRGRPCCKISLFKVKCLFFPMILAPDK